MTHDKKLHFLNEWFQQQGWMPLPFQLEAWNAIFAQASGLISVPTGAGKTYAAFLPALAEMHFSQPRSGLQILYITPLKALARDLEKAIQKPITDLKLPYRVERRTGDTSSYRKQKLVKSSPEILLTTPESLSIMLSDPKAQDLFKNLRTVIIDEWHELLASKRGVLLELCVARLKNQNAHLQIWGLTATIANLMEAAQVCVGSDRSPVIIQKHVAREIDLEIIAPAAIDQLAWSGQLGLKMLPFVLERLSPLNSTLIFTNTRNQAERWAQAIIQAKPEWKDILALHHSSIDKNEREKIEEGMKEGMIRMVVCTSSLDLGIDFSPVDRVIQIGSPKSIARLMQRAGRASHQPFMPCKIALVPTHALEIAELKAFRLALKEHIIEKRIPLKKCFDVLMQHMISCAIGEGFTKEALFAEIKTTAAFSDLTLEEFEACLLFLVSGGKALQAYPDYKKLLLEEGRYVVKDRQIILRHRMNIGTIASDPHVPVKLTNGKNLGVVEENFLAQLSPGDHFLFGGRILKLIQFRDLVAYVRIGKKAPKIAAVWQGSRLPYSMPLGALLRQVLDQKIDENHPEGKLLNEIVNIQQKFSLLPHRDELLIEITKTREGWHLFLFPFEGKAIHQGLASLLAFRLSQFHSDTFTLSCNDYGLEIITSKPIDPTLLNPHLFNPAHLDTDITHILNTYELGKGFFRNIARIAGLIFQGYPGQQKTHRQLQVSSTLIYEVFSQYDPENLLLLQARHEVIENYLEFNRLQEVLKRLTQAKIVIKHTTRLTPFSLPLFIERVSGKLSTETLAERIEKIKSSWKN